MTIRATPMEKRRRLPGDGYLPREDGRITHAITIGAPPAAVWPWLAQMGCGRAGWYSYDQIDNGGRVSARVIHPEWQHLEIGERLHGSPSDPDGEGFEVIGVDPAHYLLLTSYNHLPGFEPVHAGDKPRRFWRTTWCFFLEPAAAGRTRLLVRSNLHFRPWWLVYPLAQLLARPLHFIMQRRQLNGIKERCESLTPAKTQLPKYVVHQ